MLNTVEQVIDALGGTSAVASITRNTDPAVSNWKQRGWIPSSHYLRIRNALVERDLDVDPAVFRMDGGELTNAALRADLST